jgi:capsular polysaccharide biosynthesis protein
MKMNIYDNKRVDYKKVLGEIWKRKKLFLYTLPITFVLSSLYIISVPRMYNTDTEVAPEVEGSPNSSSALGSLASTFGLDLSSMQSADAITPLLYPDLMDDNGFITELFKIKVKSLDGSINTDYYTYLKKYQKTEWWNFAIGWLANQFKKNTLAKKRNKLDPYNLSKSDNEIANAIRTNIKISVDKKTGSISINTLSQDPLICKTIADSTREHLQQFIIRYRTNKARTDMEYYRKLTADAKRDYERQRQVYGSYSDANTDVLLESYKSKQEDLENEMQLKYNTYSTLNNQLQAAIAKVQERTPAFILIKGASVPVKPISPKRMVFVLLMLFLAFIVTSLYVLKEIISPRNLINS